MREKEHTPSASAAARSTRLVWAVCLIVFGGLAIWACFKTWRAWTQLGTVSPIAEVAFVGAAACLDCHADRHASWSRTFHRTMTQVATQASVVGAFDGKPQRAFGGEMRPQWRDGKFWFDYTDPQTAAPLASLQLGRTVGSHRYQQYLMEAQDGSGTWYRLHYLWHLGEQRWVHMNAAFLGDDSQPFDAQVASWNNNCIFCHNTGPEPRASNLQALRVRANAGEQFQARDEMTFNSTVADLGIGCESCHGPGAEHVSRNQDFFRRFALKLNGGVDPTIVNARRLAAERSTQICGACHAGRAPKDAAMLELWMTKGQSYRAGDNLNAHVDVLWAHSPSPVQHDPQLFANRFWGDGSPRLSAYEYQGMTRSKCFEESELSCINCHSMHEGDPAGMLTERARGNAPCLKCHQDKGGEQLATHTQHAPDSKASNCVNCHMPNAVYGVMDIKRTHLIEVPDAAKSASAGKPNACTNCHADKSLLWAQQQTAKLWQQPNTTQIVRRDGAAAEIPDGIASLIAGDPVQQAIAAHQPGWRENLVPTAQLEALLPYLVTALSDDRPAIRRFARLSLLTLEDRAPEKWRFKTALQKFDFTGPANEREAAIAALRAENPMPLPDPELLARLQELGRAQEKQIDIGE